MNEPPRLSTDTPTMETMRKHSHSVSYSHSHSQSQYQPPPFLHLHTPHPPSTTPTGLPLDLETIPMPTPLTSSSSTSTTHALPNNANHPLPLPHPGIMAPRPLKNAISLDSFRDAISVPVSGGGHHGGDNPNPNPSMTSSPPGVVSAMGSPTTFTFPPDYPSLSGTSFTLPRVSSQAALVSPPFSPPHSRHGSISNSISSSQHDAVTTNTLSHLSDPPTFFSPEASPPNERLDSAINQHPHSHSLSMRISQENLSFREDRLGEDLSNSLRQAMGISPRLELKDLESASAPPPPPSASASQPQQPGQHQSHGLGVGLENISLEDKAVVNIYFDELANKLEEMRGAYLTGNTAVASERSKELRQAVDVAMEVGPPPPATAASRASRLSSRSGSVSSYMRHSTSASIDSSHSSPPLSHPFGGFPPTPGRYARPEGDGFSTHSKSLKRSASFSDWDDEDEHDSGRLAKSMRLSDSYDEDDDADSIHSPPGSFISHPQSQQGQAQGPGQPLMHAHSFPSLHDLPSRGDGGANEHLMSAPIQPRVQTISNATVVPDLASSQRASGLPHLHFEQLRQNVGTASAPSSPIDYAPPPLHQQPPMPLQSYYPIQNWVNNTMPYSGLGFDLGSAGEPFPGAGFMGGEPDFQQEHAAAYEFPVGFDAAMHASQVFMGGGGGMDGFGGEVGGGMPDFGGAAGGGWPHHNVNVDMDFNHNHNQAGGGDAGGMTLDPGTTPMPPSLMQQNHAPEPAMHDVPAPQQPQPSLSRRTSAASSGGVKRRTMRRQPSSSMVAAPPKEGTLQEEGQFQPPHSSGDTQMQMNAPMPMPMPMSSSASPPNRHATSSAGPANIIPPAPPMMGMSVLPKAPPPSSFKMSAPPPLASVAELPAKAIKVKTESPSRPLSRQPSKSTSHTSSAGYQLSDTRALDVADVSRRLKSRPDSPVSSHYEDESDEDGEDTPDGYPLASRRPSGSHVTGKIISRGNSKKKADGAPHVSHHNVLTPELKVEVDRIFFDFLKRLCSDLEATDQKGELIHQTLMPKKMQKLDESPDFRPFKFRIQAFTNAFVEELARQGYPEDRLPLKKIRTYLWSQRYISRYNEDGRKSKSKGNHIWNIQAKRVAEGGWTFREYQRRISGTPAGIAYVGLTWRWTPSIWDPQHSRSSLHPVFSSPSLPSWLSWHDNELCGTPTASDTGGEILAEAIFPNEADSEKLTHSFTLEVAELSAVEMAAVKARRPSETADRPLKSPPGSAGRRRSHTVAGTGNMSPEVSPLPVRQFYSPPAQSARASREQVRQVLETAAVRISQEAMTPPAQGLPEAAHKQRQISLMKQQRVLTLAAQAYCGSYADSGELAHAAQRVVEEAARQVAERVGKPPPADGSPPNELITVSLTDVTVATRLMITKAINHVGLDASEMDIIKTASALIPHQLTPLPLPVAQFSQPTMDFSDLSPIGQSGFQNLSSIHPVPNDPLGFDMASLVYNHPPSGFNHQDASMHDALP